MLINDHCKSCLIRKNIQSYPADASPEKIRTYQAEVRSTVENADGLSTPQVAGKLYALHEELFGTIQDYSEIKRHFNYMMLSLLSHMEQQVHASEDPLKAAVQYSMVGNYIDFGALASVEEEELKNQLGKAADIEIDEDLLEEFREEVLRARKLVLFTDNCGEIVTDRLLLSTLRELNPRLHVTVIVRGEPVVNDATLADAAQVHMEEAADRILGSGAGLPGTAIEALSPEAKKAACDADLLIAKGQGNYEGLSECGLNVFYFFLCKCELFMQRFDVPQFTGIMTRELSRGAAPLH